MSSKRSKKQAKTKRPALPTPEQVTAKADRLAKHARILAYTGNAAENGGFEALELAVLLRVPSTRPALEVLLETSAAGYPSKTSGTPSSGGACACPELGEDGKDFPCPHTGSAVEHAATNDTTPAVTAALAAIQALEQLADAHYRSESIRRLTRAIKATHNDPARAGDACKHCGHLLAPGRTRCFRTDCPNNQPDRSCGECGKQVPENEQMTKGMHKACYDRTRRAKTEDERGTPPMDVHNTTGMTTTEDAAA